MKRKSRLPELLSPAGDLECLYAAVEGGADAVYVGGMRFGARAYAKNFDIDELSRAVNYCHLFGVRLYVTVNTLVYDREIPELIEYARELWRIGVDALIVADLGVLSALREHLPELELHASTQMSVHNAPGADIAAELGCSRVVVARELSIENIRRLTEESAVETEVFLHGALCVSHSGQCLFSSLVGGRSGNRGECAQPCRLPYNGGRHLISLKDLSLAEHIPELIDSGVASLKIEGRMKSPYYVYTVTKIYRTLLDQGRRANADECRELAAAFSRGGFTDGYFIGKTRGAMTGVRSDEDKEISRSVGEYKPKIKKRRVFASAVFRLGEKSQLQLFDGERRVVAWGPPPVPSENSPLLSSDVAARLMKMGNTYLSLSEEDITLDIEEGVNLPPSAINALRREAAALYESSAREPVQNATADIKAQSAFSKKSEKNKPLHTAEIMDAGVYRALKGAGLADKFSRIFIPLFSDDSDFSDGALPYIPPVVTDSELSQVRDRLTELCALGVGGVMVGNLGHIALARSMGLRMYGGFRLNIINSRSLSVYRSLGVVDPVLSPELTLPQARDVGGGVVVCGRIPLMLTERCFIRDGFGCEKCGCASLCDRKGEKFPMMREWGHRNIIFNSAITYVGDKKSELSRNSIFHRHFIIGRESPREAAELVRSYFSGAPIRGTTVRRIGRREIK